jgi:hypothetical protein
MHERSVSATVVARFKVAARGASMPLKLLRIYGIRRTHQKHWWAYGDADQTVHDIASKHRSTRMIESSFAVNARPGFRPGAFSYVSRLP